MLERDNLVVFMIAILVVAVTFVVVGMVMMTMTIESFKILILPVFDLGDILPK
jgi:hypothetical protein